MMDARRSRRGESSVLHAESKNGKSRETMFGWSGKPFILKLALMIFMGLLVLLLPLSALTGTSSFRLQRLIDHSIFAAEDITTDIVKSKPDEALEGNSTGVARSKVDETLGGLLLPPAVFEDSKCISRSQEYPLRKPSVYKPSSYLISKLRGYERRHRKCALEAKNFDPKKNATEQGFGECRFVVWMASSGLGNRIMTLTSAFVYALLTDRVLLIGDSKMIDDLFCEPFPSTSWLLPEAFPHEWMQALDSNSSSRFGFLTRNRTFTSSHNGYAYLNLMHDYDDDDRKFFCAQCQVYLSSFPWLFLRSNQYFVPGLHFVPEFHAELDRLFPERETVFHHVIRYLLHPSDSVWELISNFYANNLASAQRKVGLQVRVIRTDVTFPAISDMVLSCTLEKKFLPNVTLSQDHQVLPNETSNSTSLLIASLHKIFYERIRGFFLDQPTPDGQNVGVYTASYEEEQSLGSLNHDKKALADMYLLSFSDTLVTSAWSTFGYVAQGIAGTIPWFLTKLDSAKTAQEVIRKQGPCNLGLSLEPCFHSAPTLDCEGRGWGYDPGKTHPYIQHCEDVWWGIKIMDASPDSN